MKSTTKNNLLKVLLIAFCLTIASFLGLSLTKTNKASASETFFKMEYGASIRYTEGSTGIRFRATVDEDTYNEVMADANKNFGMLIVPEIMLTNANITSDYIANLQTAYPSQTLGLIDIEGTRAFEKVGNAYKFAGVLSNLRFNNMNRDFFGIAYIKTVDGGNVSYEYATFKKTENVRNIVFVASNVINNEAKLTTAQKSILTGFINDGVKKAAGLTQQDEVPELNATLFGTENLTDMFVGQKTKLSAVITRTVNGIEEELKSSVKFTFTSSDESVVKVGIDGTVTAVGGGTATITASNVFLDEDNEVPVSVETPAPAPTVNNLPDAFYNVGNWTGSGTASMSVNNGTLSFADASNKAIYTDTLDYESGFSFMFKNTGDSEVRLLANDGATTYYKLGYGWGYFYIVRSDNGSWISSLALSADTWYRVDVSYSETNSSVSLSVTINGQKLAKSDTISGISYENGVITDTNSKINGQYFGVKATGVSIKPIEEDTETRIKVACIGDSTTYGQGSATSTSYPTILQDMLGDTDYVVENFGANSTTLIPTNVGWAWAYTGTSSYTSALAFAPDIVVINFGLNDANFNIWGTTNGVGARGEAQAYYDSCVAMINAFRKANPEVRIIVCTPSQTFDYSDNVNDKHYSARGVNVDYAIIPTITDVCFYNGCELADINGATVGLTKDATADGLHYLDYTIFAETVYEVIANEPEYLYSASNFIVNEYETLYTYYEITLNTPTNGSIAVDKDVVVAGEDVVITITPDEGYVLSAITVNGVSKISEVVEGTLTIENVVADIEVVATFGTEVEPEPEITVRTDEDFFDVDNWNVQWGSKDSTNADVHISQGAIAWVDVGGFEGEYEFKYKASSQAQYIAFGVTETYNTINGASPVHYGIGWNWGGVFITKEGVNNSWYSYLTTVDLSTEHTYKIVFTVDNSVVTMSVYVDGVKLNLTQQDAKTGITYVDGNLVDSTGNIPQGTYVQLECYGSGAYISKP